MLIAANALGIGAASFWSVAEKDIAESPTASPERPEKDNKSTRPQDYKFFQLGVIFALSHEPENDEENNIVVTNNNIRMYIIIEERTFHKSDAFGH